MISRIFDSRAFSIAGRAGAVAAGFLAVSAISSLYGSSPLASLQVMIVQPLTDLYSFSEVLVRFTAIYTVAMGVSIALRAGLWNIGGEGQFLAGAVACLYIAKVLQGHAPPAAVMAAMMAGASLIGALWILPAAFLRARYGVNEIITTLMLNIVASNFALYALDGPIRGQGSFGYLITDPLPQSLRLPVILKYPVPSGSQVVWVDTRLSASIFFAAALAAILYVVVERTPRALHMGVMARSWDLARYAGIGVERYVYSTMILSGSLAGLAGALHIMGVLYRFDSGQIDHGFGYMGVIAAAVGGGGVVWSALSSFFLSMVLIGAESLGRALGASYTLTWASIGAMLILTALSGRARPGAVRG